MRGGSSKGGMQGMLKQLQKVQGEMQKINEKLIEKEVEGTAGGDMVIVRMNGNREIKDLKISKEIVNPNDVEMLQDLIIAAINDANRRVEEMIENEMGSLAKGFGIPGLDGIF